MIFAGNPRSQPHHFLVNPLTGHVLRALVLLSCMGGATQPLWAQTISEEVWTAPEPKKAPLPEEVLPYCQDVKTSRTPKTGAGDTLAVADSTTAVVNQDVYLKGQACISRDEVRMQGDTIHYDYPSEQVTAAGHTKMLKADGGSISGQNLQYNLSSETGRVTPADFTVSKTEGHGKAESLTILSSRRALLSQARYTTCQAEDPDWYIKTDSLILDQDNDQGIARNATLVFKDLPILASPYMRVPLGNKRQSGVLTPTFGYATGNGATVIVPYYFNIAPNYDATLYPAILSNRGVRLGAEYRYLTRWGSGQLYGEYMPKDKKTDTKRYYWMVQHTSGGDLGRGKWRAEVNWQKVSDSSYIDDFGSRIANTDTRIIPSTFSLQYKDDELYMRLRRKTYQTLQDSSKSVEVPYDFEPQLKVNYKKRWGNWVFNTQAESTHFTHPDKTDHARGWRNIIYPSLSYEWRQPGAFIIPKIGVHATQYNLSYVPTNTGVAYDKNATRVLPIISVDSGLILERNTRWFNKDVIQTLEPRLYYAYVPYRDQTKIWNFDSALADLDFSRIYTENLFTGSDRIAQANQITTGVTSRILSQQTGEELLQASIAQRHYFDQQSVTLPNTTTLNTSRKSDVLAAMSGRIMKNVWAQGFVQYNVDNNKLLRSDAAIRWQPGFRQVLNVGYHENRILTEPARSVYLSTQFPVPYMSNNLYAVARLNYNLKSKKFSNAYAGFEYVKDCWIFRLVAQREQTSTNTFNNSIYFQLELKGLGNLGQSASKLLSEQIDGYHSPSFTDAVNTNHAD